MFRALHPRLDHEHEEGFTLIELMVVVLIIGILLAIAIPTFLGARNRANDRSAQSNLRNALTAEKTLFTDTQSYSTTNAAGITALGAIEPSITWVAAGTSYASRNVAAVVGTATAVVLATQSATGSCWYIADLTTGTPSGTYFAQTASPCNATMAAPTAAVTQATSGLTVGSWALAF